MTYLPFLNPVIEVFFVLLLVNIAKELCFPWLPFYCHKMGALDS